MGHQENLKAIEMRIFALENLRQLVEELMETKNAKQMNKALIALQNKLAELDELPMPCQRKQN